MGFAVETEARERAVADLVAVEGALDVAVAAIARMPAGGPRQRLQTLASILRRSLATWALTPPSPRQLSFVWHQIADLVLEAKSHADRSLDEENQRLAVWLVKKAR